MYIFRDDVAIHVFAVPNSIDKECSGNNGVNYKTTRIVEKLCLQVKIGGCKNTLSRILTCGKLRRASLLLSCVPMC